MESFPSCPECGGKCAFFKNTNPAISVRFLMPSIEVYSYTCLECGYITLRVHPDDLKRLHQIAEKSLGKAPRSCPECGGERAFFKPSYVENTPALITPGLQAIPLFACVCLQCGTTTERPLPKVLDTLRKIAAIKYSRLL